MTDLALPRVDRPAFFTGQRLLPGTLDDAFTMPLALHWLHNRALHGVGVAFGLDVGAARGATTVTVSAGYALDGAGRDLVLAEPRAVPVPPVAQAPNCGPAVFHLAISYTDDPDAAVEKLAGLCGATGAVRRADDPTVRFVPDGDIRDGIDLILATVQVRNCKLDAAPSFALRRSALPAGRPYVAGGESGRYFTDWQPWPDSGPPAGVVASVSTAAAGFGDPPRYEARVDGVRAVPAAWSPTGAPLVVDGTLAIDNVTAAGFDAIVLLPQGFVAGGSALNPAAVFTPGFLTDLGWQVVWIGVEGGNGRADLPLPRTAPRRLARLHPHGRRRRSGPRRAPGAAAGRPGRAGRRRGRRAGRRGRHRRRARRHGSTSPTRPVTASS